MGNNLTYRSGIKKMKNRIGVIKSQDYEKKDENRNSLSMPENYEG